MSLGVTLIMIQGVVVLRATWPTLGTQAQNKKMKEIPPPPPPPSSLPHKKRKSSGKWNLSVHPETISYTTGNGNSGKTSYIFFKKAVLIFQYTENLKKFFIFQETEAL